MAARREPAWLSAPATGGRSVDLALASALANPLPVTLWTPDGLGDADPAPLVWCHDGPEYAQRAALLQWAGAHVEDGSLPPFRLALAQPQRRNQIYSASPRYLRSVDRAVADLRDRVPVESPLAVMGASLGGLTSLLVALRDPGVGCVLSQSGSFFEAGGEDRAWRWFERVVGAADRVRDGAFADRSDDLLIGLTCGRDEGNLAANRGMRDALRRQRFDVAWQTVRGGHDWDTWRDTLDPVWPDLLRRAWSG